MEYPVVCIGLTKAGKTTLLSVLCNESCEDIAPTTGFSIKPCVFSNCILNIKEIGGGERQRPYWRHYYRDTSAVVFVIDCATSMEEMSTARAALHEALAHPDLNGLPCLILANCQDKPDARSLEQVTVELDIESLLPAHRCDVYLCSALKDGSSSIRQCFEKFIDTHLSSHGMSSCANAKSELAK
jgi:small GTP-binding protein